MITDYCKYRDIDNSVDIGLSFPEPDEDEVNSCLGCGGSEEEGAVKFEREGG